MATYNFSVTGSRETQSADIPAGTPTTFSIDNPLPYTSYFALETVRNANGFYDSSSPRNLSGSFTLGDGVVNFVKSDYIAAAVIQSGGGELRFEPTIDITGSNLYLRGTGA